MKKLTLLMAIAALVSTISGYGEQNIIQTSNNFGYRSYGKETVDFIHANGSIVLDGTIILGSVKLNGSMEANDASIDSFHINGQANLKNSIVNNDAFINGSLVAENSKFHKDLSASSKKVILKLCTIENLKIRPVAGYNGIQVVDLRNGTKVLGSIIVESGHGEIWLSPNSEVIGNISGAQVVRK